MYVWEVLKYWPILESANMPLASPVVAKNGREWSQKGITQAVSKSLHMDYEAVHWYGWPNANAFKAKLWSVYNLYGGNTPLLITEFAPANWSAKTVPANRHTRKQVLNFMEQVLPWLEETDWILGYAWFPFNASWPIGTCSSLFKSDGKTPTKLGLYYANFMTTTAGTQSSLRLSTWVVWKEEDNDNLFLSSSISCCHCAEENKSAFILGFINTCTWPFCIVPDLREQISTAPSASPSQTLSFQPSSQPSMAPSAILLREPLTSEKRTSEKRHEKERKEGLQKDWKEEETW